MLSPPPKPLPGDRPEACRGRFRPVSAVEPMRTELLTFVFLLTHELRGEPETGQS